MVTAEEILKSVVELASSPFPNVHANTFSLTPRINLGGLAFSATLAALCEGLQFANNGGVDDNKLQEFKLSAEKTGSFSMNTSALTDTGLLTNTGTYTKKKRDAAMIKIQITRVPFKDPWFVERRA